MMMAWSCKGMWCCDDDGMVMQGYDDGRVMYGNEGAAMYVQCFAVPGC
jgi:hypothetical protein